MALADSQSVAVDQANAFVHALTTNDGKLITQMRLSDGYVNGTVMTKACKKLLADYMRLKDTKAFLEGQANDMGITIPSLVQQQHGHGAGKQCTWVHPEVAIDLARWCSVEFRIKVNRLVTRYLTGQLTTAESKAASKAAAQAVQVVDDSKHGVDVQALLDWHDKSAWKTKSENRLRLWYSNSTGLEQGTRPRGFNKTYTPLDVSRSRNSHYRDRKKSAFMADITSRPLSK
jgi:hypothetical protein